MSARDQVQDVETSTLVARWWQAWRDEDYSWQGLSTKPVMDGNEPDAAGHLQAWWATDPESGHPRSVDVMKAAGELIEDPDGRLWHLAHVPLHWGPDQPSWKASATSPQWEQLRTIVRGRLTRASATSGSWVTRMVGEIPRDYWTPSSKITAPS